MGLNNRKRLRANQDFNGDHDDSVFASEFHALDGETSQQAEDRIVAYFTSLGDAGTLTFTGTNGTDYHFTRDGFKALTGTGTAKLVVSDILTGDDIRYLTHGGMSLSFQLKTDEWVCPQPNPPSTYVNPVDDMNGTASDSNWRYLMNYYQNDTSVSWSLETKNDSIYQTSGTNKLQFTPVKTRTNPSTCSRPISSFDKGEYSDVMLTLHDGVGNYWIDGISAVPPHGSSVPTSPGPRRTRRTVTQNQQFEHTAGDAFLIIGNYSTAGGANSLCDRYVRNLRLFKTHVDLAITREVGLVVGFGDSFTNVLGPQPNSSGTDVSVGRTGTPGGIDTVNDHFDFADIEPILRFGRQMTKAGHQMGGMYMAGQGGWHLSTGGAQSLFDTGFHVTLKERYMPSMVLTIGVNNDVSSIVAGNITLAAFKANLMDDIIAPVLARGNTYGWGIVIPAKSSDVVNSSTLSAMWDDVADMLIAFPADFDAAYPNLAGMVKVRDIRATMGDSDGDGVTAGTNRNWRDYYVASDTTHPSRYGQMVEIDASAEMAIEWVQGR